MIQAYSTKSCEVHKNTQRYMYSQKIEVLCDSDSQEHIQYIFSAGGIRKSERQKEIHRKHFERKSFASSYIKILRLHCLHMEAPFVKLLNSQGYLLWLLVTSGGKWRNISANFSQRIFTKNICHSFCSAAIHSESLPFQLVMLKTALCESPE